MVPIGSAVDRPPAQKSCPGVTLEETSWTGIARAWPGAVSGFARKRRAIRHDHFRTAEQQEAARACGW